MTAPNKEPIESNDDGNDETLEVVHDSHAVPPPAQSEIDALVDAVSAGGRPRPVNELEWFAEDDSDPASPETPRYESPPPQTSLIPAGMFRFAAASIAAFALGVLIALGVLRSVDYSPASVAVNAPAPVAVNPPAPPLVNRAPAFIPIEAPPAPVPTPPPAPEPAPVEAPAVQTLAINVPPQPRAATPVVRPGTTTVLEAARSVSAPRPPARPDAPPREAAAVETVAAPPAPPSVAVAPAVSPPIVTPPPPAPALLSAAAPAAAARSAAAVAHSAVIATVREYTQAYGAMDVGAAAAVWPSVDRRALSRAFATLKSQQLELGNCEVTIFDTSATARCRGKLEYVRKVGDPTPRTGHQQWLFKMRKLGEEWIIDGLDASPVAELLPTVTRGAT